MCPVPAPADGTEEEGGIGNKIKFRHFDGFLYRKIFSVGEGGEPADAAIFFQDVIDPVKIGYRFFTGNEDLIAFCRDLESFLFHLFIFGQSKTDIDFAFDCIFAYGRLFAMGDLCQKVGKFL